MGLDYDKLPSEIQTKECSSFNALFASSSFKPSINSNAR